VKSVAIWYRLPDASKVQKTLYRAAAALSAGRPMQILVSVLAMRRALRLVFSMALTQDGFSQALICPASATQTATGLH
jgi:hypothetical protein